MKTDRRKAGGARSRGAKTLTAYELLREKILSMELAPGDFLNERDLMATTGIGRTPLREAILKLAQQRMVSIGARRTPQVSPLTLSDLTSIPEARRILEIPAARLAAERATDAERAELRRTNELFRQHAKHRSWRQQVAVDDRIHKLIAAASHNAHLADAVGRLNAQSYRLWVLGARGSEVVGALDDNTHGDIVDAIVRGDPEAAERSMAAHIEQFARRVQTMAASGALQHMPAPMPESVDVR